MVNIIIVNWNSGQGLSKCLRSIIESERSQIDLRITVVDNDSSDNSIELTNDLRGKFDLIRTGSNLGFGKANNLVLKQVKEGFVLLINPDVVLFKDTLDKCLSFMRDHDEVDILGVKNLYPDGNTARTCARFPNTIRYINDMTGLSKLLPKIFLPGTIMTDWDHSTSKFVDHVIAAFTLIRVSTLSKVGLFDERFFMYLEDLDLSNRFKRTGAKVYYNTDITVIHEGGGSSKNIKASALFYSLQSRILYCEKYNDSINPLIIKLFSIIIEPIIRCLFALARLDSDLFRNTLIGYRNYYKWLSNRRQK